MKKLLFLFLFIISFFQTAFASENFNITMLDALKEQSKLNVKVNNLKDIVSIDLYVGDIKLLKGEIKGNNYTFLIPNNFKINPLNKNISLKVKFKNQKIQEYLYDKFFPEFYSIDLLDLTGGKLVDVKGHLTGSCKLFYDKDKYWNLSYDKNKAVYTVKIPDLISQDISGGYVNCDGLSSFYKKFYIPASPKIIYVISKDKKLVVPGSYMLLIGKNIKLSKNDNIKLLLNGKELNFKLLNNNKLEFKLPNEVVKEASLQVIRNGFKSNIIKISSKKYIFIKNVNLNYKNGKNIFRLYGDFDFRLGTPEIYFNSRKLQLVSTGKNAKISWIDVLGPEVKFKGKTFSCSWYFESGYFQVKFKNVSSNKFFYSPDSNIEINYVLLPTCRDGTCYVKAYVSKNVDKIKVFLNGRERIYSSFGNLLSIETNDDLEKKGSIYLVNRFCIKSPTFYYDYEDKFKPLITYIQSSNNFKSQGSFTIYGNKLTRDGTYKDIKLSIKAIPDVITYKKGFSTIKGEVKYGTEDGTKVKIDLSTRHGKSNGVSFVVGGKNKYLGNPVIKNVLYPDGAEGGQIATIKGVGFSERCSENKIYFAGKVIYPNNCSYSSLEFEIPSNLQADKIYVKVNESTSNEYKLNTRLGSVIDKKQLNIIKSSSSKIINLSKDTLNQEIKFNIENTITDLYIPELKFIIKGVDFLPAYDFVLSINKNDKKSYDKKSYLNWENNKVLFTTDKNLAYVKKTNEGLEIIFKGVYIPFVIAGSGSLKFKLIDNLPNNTNFELIFPKQKIYYYNIFDTKKSHSLDLSNSFSVKYKILNTENVCFDSVKDFSNCALVLQGKQLNKKEKKSESKNNLKDLDKKNTQPKQVKKNKIKKLTKKEKIAKKLDIKKMKLINKLIKNFIIKLKRKYGKDKQKLRLIVEMYRGYKQMLKNTENTWENKLKYVDGLLYFVQNYYKFNKLK